MDGPEISIVYIDHPQSTLEGLEHLYGQEYRTVACVGAPYGDSCASSSRCIGGYRRFEEAHSDVTVTLLEIENDRIYTGYALINRIRESETPIDGIFAGSDEIAAGVLQAARDADISVPDELRVLGFDDQPISEMLGIFTVRQPIGKMGNIAAEKSIEHVDAGDRKKAERYRIKHRLVQRNTPIFDSEAGAGQA